MAGGGKDARLPFLRPHHRGKWKKQSKVARHDEEIKDHERRIKALEAKNLEQEEFIKVLCNSILALISHEINGNSKDKLKDAQKELQDFLINK